jgi:hypothetical protein
MSHRHEDTPEPREPTRQAMMDDLPGVLALCTGSS